MVTRAVGQEGREVRRARTIASVLGALTAIPVPGFAYALTASSAFGMVLLPVRSIGRWPVMARALLAWALVAVGAVALSAVTQNVAVPTLLVVSLLSFALLLAAMAKTTDGVETSAYLVLWSAVGMIAFFVLVGAENTRDTFEHLWKYGIAVPIALAAVALVVMGSSSRMLPIATLLLIGAASVALGFRSHGLVCLAVVLILFAKGRVQTRRGAIFKVLFAAALFWAASVILPAAITAGVFGAEVAARTEEQTSDGASPLLSGRVEPPLALAAVAERFFTGWGNLNAIDAATIARGQQIAADLGLTDPKSYMGLWIRRDGRVSLHSVLFESWAQGGILAAVFALLLIGLFVAAIFKADGRWAPLVLLVSVQGTWDLLFSTWGAQRPMLLAVSSIVACWAITAPRFQHSLGPADAPPMGVRRPSLVATT